MIYRRRRAPTSTQGGFYTFHDENDNRLFGPGDGDTIYLKDDDGKVWTGLAEVLPDHTVRYHFRDPEGNSMSGISDGDGITLRDQKGKTWRGFVG